MMGVKRQKISTRTSKMQLPYFIKSKTSIESCTNILWAAMKRIILLIKLRHCIFL